MWWIYVLVKNEQFLEVLTDSERSEEFVQIYKNLPFFQVKFKFTDVILFQYL